MGLKPSTIFTGATNLAKSARRETRQSFFWISKLPKVDGIEVLKTLKER